MGIEIDYIKLIDECIGKDKLIRVYFYAGIDNENNQSMGWKYFMKRAGFKMMTKQLEVFPNGLKKANYDVEMVVDMLSLIDKYDTAILITVNTELVYAIHHLINQGKQVEIIDHKNNSIERCINIVDRFIDLESIKNCITKAVKDDYNPSWYK